MSRDPGLVDRAASSLHADASGVLHGFEHADPGQQALRREYLDFLGEHDDAMWRSLGIGHLTASALVMDESGSSVLLTLHPKVGRWLQLGGHCEPGDASVRAAARREVIEESGIDQVWISEQPIRLDRHPVPCGGMRSEHLDVQYLALVPDGSVPVISHESDDLRWFELADLPSDLDASVDALIRDARALLAKRQEFLVHRRDGSFPA